MATANAALEQAGLPTWSEPDGVDARSFEMFGYWGLHTLRRVAAHLKEYGALPDPLGEERSLDDPTLTRLYGAAPTHGITSRKRLGGSRSPAMASPHREHSTT